MDYLIGVGIGVVAGVVLDRLFACRAAEAIASADEYEDEVDAKAREIANSIKRVV